MSNQPSQQPLAAVFRRCIYSKSAASNRRFLNSHQGNDTLLDISSSAYVRRTHSNSDLLLGVHYWMCNLPMNEPSSRSLGRWLVGLLVDLLVRSRSVKIPLKDIKFHSHVPIGEFVYQGQQIIFFTLCSTITCLGRRETWDRFRSFCLSINFEFALYLQ